MIEYGTKLIAKLGYFGSFHLGYRLGYESGQIDTYVTIANHLISQGMSAINAVEHIGTPQNIRLEVLYLIDNPDYVA